MVNEFVQSRNEKSVEKLSSQGSELSYGKHKGTSPREESENLNVGNEPLSQEEQKKSS
jgi:hypothetical protein